MNVCKNICERLEIKPITTGFVLLGSGWKKCRTCAISIKTDYLTCPCCKRKLSTHTRYKSKKKNLNMKAIHIRVD
jgi:hypothetical protein